VTEIDDRAGSVADDAAQLSYRCRFMDAKVPSEVEIRLANRQCLLDVPEVGVACSEALQDRPLFGRLVFQAGIDRPVDQDLGQGNRKRFRNAVRRGSALSGAISGQVRSNGTRCGSRSAV